MYDITLTSPGALCYYADSFSAEPVRAGDWVGSVAEGGSVNHRQVRFTPHGTGTHTECYGHISPDPDATLDKCLTQFAFAGKLLTVAPSQLGDDKVITLASVEASLPAPGDAKAVIFRTLPNDPAKQTRNYSGTNPPYLEPALAERLVALGIEHLLVDLPSVDPEVDGGKLLFHKAFWQTEGPAPLRRNATITELVFVPDHVPDGAYTVYIAPAKWVLDAAPSRVWLA